MSILLLMFILCFGFKIKGALCINYRVLVLYWQFAAGDVVYHRYVQ